MIKKITVKSSDNLQILKHEQSPALESSDTSFDYSNVIVNKPWGYEFLIFENRYVAIWMLHIVRKRQTSMHSHPKKITSLTVLSGNATCAHLEGSISLGPMDGLIIEKGAFHSTEASSELPMNPVSENGIWVMEIESPPDKLDLVRLKDQYGRAGKSYEGANKMVFDPKDIFKMEIPPANELFQKRFHDCSFTVGNGSVIKKMKEKTSGVLAAIIAIDNSISGKGSEVSIGETQCLDDLLKNIKEDTLSRCTVMTVEKGTVLKLSDYIFSFIADLGVKEVFAVSGGGAMHLVDSLGRNESLEYIATHHEQAAAMAAEGSARISGVPGVALTTSGPGGTNALTGVCGAWIDSIPTIYLSGQVTSNTLIENTGLRQFGIQESNIIDIVSPVTKYAVTVKDPHTIKYHLQKAVHLAMSGRPGPVWLDIPLDVQSKMINPDEQEVFTPPEDKHTLSASDLAENVRKTIEWIEQARRPVLISGYGIRLSGAEQEFRKVVEKLKIPVISSWTSSDLLFSDHPCYIGRSGIMGDRAGNFTVQNSDLLLIVGSRMSIPQVGYNFAAFARASKKIVVDIDQKELEKPSLRPDLPILADAKAFIEELDRQLGPGTDTEEQAQWMKRCLEWKKKYPVCLPEYNDLKERVNSFYFVDLLASKLDNQAIVVTDMGTSFTCTMQTFKVKQGQRLFTSSGHASMGFGLPGAIGACIGSGRKKTICISGDGGLQMNIQELQTIVHYKLPILLFVLNNGGYLTIKLMQQNHFGRYVGSEKSSGVTCPDIVMLGKAYGIESTRVLNQDELNEKIDDLLTQPGPMICEIMMPEDQPLIPRVSSLKKPDGTIISKPIEDLYPFLPREEFEENMIVEHCEVLK